MFASARMAATFGDVVNVDGEEITGGDVCLAGVGAVDGEAEAEGSVGGGVGMVPKERGGGIVEAEAAGAVEGTVS